MPETLDLSAPQQRSSRLGADSDPESETVWRLFRTLLPGRPLQILAATLGLYLLILIPRLIWSSESGSLWVGHLHLWGDWPFHIAMIQRFATCPPDQWLAQHPMIGGEPLRYPFASSLLSGMLMRLGLSLPAAILVPTLAAFAVLLPGMYALFRLTIGGTYRPLLAIYLFFCAAGLGFWTWVRDLAANPSLDLLLFPPKEYSAAESFEWYSSNFLSAMLLPQRSFLQGLTAAVWLLTLLLFTLTFWERLKRTQREWLLALCGVLGGLLPVVHLHSLFAVSVFCLCVLVPFAGRSWERWRTILLYFVLPGLLLAGGLYRSFLAPVRDFPHFVAWMPGLNAKQGLGQWLVMWWRFWGIALPISGIGFALFVRQWRQKKLPDWRVGFFVGAFLLFGVANLIRFQPIPWDNSKLFLWVYLALCGLMANLLARLWQSGRGVGRIEAVALAVCLMATGVLDLISLQRVDRNQAQLASGAEVRLGDFVRAQTAPDSVFLTGTDIGHWVMVVGGRPVFLGFTGWMPNFGFRHDPREKDLKTIYAGGAEAARRLKANPVDYVVIGPSEPVTFKANEAWFLRNYPLLLRRNGWSVFAVSDRARRRLAVRKTVFDSP
ncbi:MAG: hypothetical protein H7Z41_04540 [Cytophagales bacterium]|nr:hypothetical protein [Armatimonadota bacterium]